MDTEQIPKTVLSESKEEETTKMDTEEIPKTEDDIKIYKLDDESESNKMDVDEVIIKEVVNKSKADIEDSE